MFSTILTTLVALQTVQVAPSQKLYTIEYVQDGLYQGVVKVFVTPSKGYKWGDQYNAVLELKKNKYIALTKTKFTKKDFSKKGKTAVVEIPYKLKQTSDYQILKGKISFLVCNKKHCIPQRNIKI